MPAAHGPSDRTGQDRTGHTVHPGQRHSPAAPAAQPWPRGRARGPAQQEDLALLTQLPCSAASACSDLGSPNPTSACSSLSDALTPPRDNCSEPTEGKPGAGHPTAVGDAGSPANIRTSRQGPLRTGTPCHAGARP